MPSVLIVCYIYHWKNRMGAAMHGAIVMEALLLSLLPFMSMPVPLSSRRITRWLLALLLATVHFSILLFYAVLIGSRRAWGSLPTWELLAVYLRQIPSLFHQFRQAIIIPCAGLALAWLLMVIVYYPAAGPILAALRNKSAFQEKASVATRMRRSPLAWTFSWVFISVIVYAFTFPAWRQREIAHRMFFLPSTEFFAFVPEEMMLQMPLGEPERKFVNYPGSGKQPIPRTLVLITVDALRSDQMGVYGNTFDDTPFLSSMVQHGKMQRIDSAYSVCTFSFCGVLGTMSSSYRYQLTQWMQTLPDVLQPHGYQTRLIMSADHTHFYGLKHFYGSHVIEYLDATNAPKGRMNDDAVVLPWLQMIPWESEGPTFVHIHLMSVHILGVRQPKFQRWQPSQFTTSDLFAGHAVQEMYQNNYRNGVLEADDTIRNIFQLLKEKQVLENSLIVITADHGEYLGEWGRLGHGREPYEPVVRIPLLIYDPSGTVYPTRPLTSQVDIAPTLLYAIGAPVPAEWSGIPLQLSTTRNVISVASAEAAGVVVQMGDKRYKYLLNMKTHKEEVFDLTSARGEMEDLASQQPALTAQLRAMYEQLRASTGPGRIQ